MPVPSSLIGANIRAASALFGPSWLTLSEGIGIGVMAWLHANPANVFLMGGTPVGAAGAGMVTGKLICVPNPGLVYGSCVGAGLVGVQMIEIATAVSIGVANSISQAGLYVGPSVGTSGGGDVSVCTFANPATLIPALQAGIAALGPGILSPQLATGLGIGIAGMMVGGLSGTGIVAPVTPAPAVAAGFSPTSVVV